MACQGIAAVHAAAGAAAGLSSSAALCLDGASARQPSATPFSSSAPAVAAFRSCTGALTNPLVAAGHHQQQQQQQHQQKRQWAAAPVRSLSKRSMPYATISLHASASSVAEPEEKVTIDNSTVLVVGGGGVGMEVVRQLATAGSWVTAFQRGEKFRGEIESLGAMLAIGDVTQPDTIAKALRTNTFDAVVSTVGGGMTDIHVDSQGNINVIEAAEKAGIKRFVLVTSVGTGDSASAVSPKAMEVLGAVLKEKEKAEERLKSSSLEWTIVRPGSLQTESATGTAILTEDRRAVGVITRADVASLVLKVLFNDAAHGKVLAAVDPSKAFEGAPKDIAPFKSD